MTHPEREARLARTIGPVALCLFGLGNILGAGIYVLVGEVAASAGVLAPLSFVLAGAVAALSAGTYAELAARYPVSAGEAVWVQEGFGVRGVSVAVGLLIAAAGLTSAATLARGFAGYLGALVPVPPTPAAVALVLLLGGLAGWGVKESVRAAALLTLVEGAGLVLVVAVAGGAVLHEPAAVGRALGGMEGITAAGVVAGAYLAFFAFIGFEDMVNVAEEVRDPGRTMARAILWALVTAGIIYAAVVTVSVLTIAPERLAREPAPLAAVYAQAGGRFPWIMAVIGMAAVVNGILVQLIMAARIAYGMASRGWLPSPLARVHARTSTPLRATALVTAVVVALAASVDLGGLARLTSFIVLLVFVIVNAALIAVKRREPAPPGVAPVPRWMPVAGLLSAAGLLATALAHG